MMQPRTDAEWNKAIREHNAKMAEKERQRDARLFAKYQADCLKSWEVKEVDPN